MKTAGFLITSENLNANAESTRGGGTRRWSDSRGPFVLVAQENWPEPGVKHLVLEAWVVLELARALEAGLERGELVEQLNDPTSLEEKIWKPEEPTITWKELGPANKRAAATFGPGVLVKTTQGYVVTPEDLPRGLAHTPTGNSVEEAPPPGEPVDIEEVMKRLAEEEAVTA